MMDLHFRRSKESGSPVRLSYANNEECILKKLESKQYKDKCAISTAVVTKTGNILSKR